MYVYQKSSLLTSFSIFYYTKKEEGHLIFRFPLLSSIKSYSAIFSIRYCPSPIPQLETEEIGYIDRIFLFS
ncbi:hypothetical protein AZJ39_02195 [Streptococcus pneumoniae]|uniref:Uncharacterized protein n=1 Tax=Streptococcus pneumoniae TaxID=1313 RepID=A0A558QCB8_STREE|nr:hypothetical protein AK86_09360 [Streptococcus pneumoniae B1599]OYL11196.1 hypothetical protein AK85_05355 [Streptococcus pneumoniae B1598]TVV47140.1 hypothetical protein AZK39_07120 [Streptococcus pneumoniae]TVV52683.1 hypothetical protein AZK38_01950 [Streptococcus pneumoniae]TVV54191.1 hypothetical protein AZK37_11360 [Streptococcus pneumoniae]